MPKPKLLVFQNQKPRSSLEGSKKHLFCLVAWSLTVQFLWLRYHTSSLPRTVQVCTCCPGDNYKQDSLSPSVTSFWIIQIICLIYKLVHLKMGNESVCICRCVSPEILNSLSLKCFAFFLNLSFRFLPLKLNHPS